MIKKSLLLTMLLAFFAPWAANAQDTETLTIGTGTSWSNVGSNGGQGYGSAFGNTYYYNSAAQFIYTADELEGVGTIHSVAFYHNAYSFNATVNIYLFHTTATTVDPSVPITEGTPVFSGTGITLGASDEGWQTFSFGDNAFEYNGTDNLLVVICREKNGSGYSNYQKWQYTATDDNKFMVRSSDTNGYGLITNTSTYYPSTSRPNIQIAYEPVEQGDCPKPESLVASDVTAHSATLTWEGESSNGFILEWKKASESEWNSLTFNPYAHSYNVGGLDADTEYEARVQRSCGWDESFSEEILSDYRTVTFTTTIACFAPTNLAVEANVQTATFTWESNVNNYEIAHATEATADPNDNIVGTATDTVYSMSDLTIDTDHYFWVRSNCGSEGYSQWAGPVSVHIGYCVPNPTSHDGSGITGVSFGTGDYVVTNGDGSASLPATAPFYGDYSSMIGAVQAGVESTIAITTSTGSWPYTFVIWVDFDNSLSFEDSEVVYVGKASSGSGTLNATITIPATQELGDYRMRIYGADSYFNSFYGNGTTNWEAAHDPCSSGTYRHAHDYTLRVLEAPSCLTPTGLTASNVTAHGATISWTSDAGAWLVMLNDNMEDLAFVEENTYTFTELTAETEYSVKVRANCSGTYSEWTNAISFTTGIACYAPTELTAALTLGDGTVATLSWVGEAEGFVVQYGIEGDTATMNVSDTVANLTGLTPETTHFARVKAVCGGNDGESQWSNTVTFTPTNAYTLTVNDNTVTNTVVPIYGLWADSKTRSQFIIPAEDLAAMQWGSINKMTFYASADKSWGAQFKVYLTETCETTLSELYDWDDMQEVYVGIPAIVDNEMKIIFDTPYQYAGGNLLVGFYQTTTGDYSGCTWYGVTANGASLGGYNTTINQQNFLPKTTFDYVPGEEPACVPASCLAASNISFTNVTLNWFQNSSADAWNVAYSTDGEIFTTVEAETNVDYLLEDLTPNTEYTVKVSPANCEVWSNTITFTTLDPCLTPTNLTATEIEAHTAVLSWTENGLSVAWVVEITDVEGGQITTWDADTIPFTVSGLTAETEYSARVRPACNESLWSTTITFTTEEACPAPTSLAVTESTITATEATVAWEGTSNSYVVMIGETIIVLGTANFENQTIPSNWTNDASYPWVITSGAAAGGTYSMKSGNYHVHNSTSSIQITATYAENTTLEFDARCSSEQNGLNYDWDYGTFYIDGEQQGDKIINSTTFTHYSYEVEAGTHTFMWKYKKDGSANDNDDCLYVDNITNVPVPTVNDWTEYTTDAETYTFEDLTPKSTYQVKVKGDCDEEGFSVEVGPISFTTLPFSITMDIDGYGDGDGGYYLIASPLAEEVDPATLGMITDDLGADATPETSTYDLYWFDQSSPYEEWQNYRAENFNLVNGKGYLYASKADTTITFTGTPYSGDGTITLSKTDNPDAVFSGWNLVGNPFAETAYPDRGFYTMNGEGTEIISATNNSVEAMEGIFVIASEGGGVMTFSTEEPAKSAALVMNVAKNRGTIDRAIVRFGDGGTLPKIQLNPNHTKVYIPQDGKDYAVARASEMGELPVSFKAETNGTYNMSFTAEEVNFNYLHLIDNLTGNDVDLLVNPSYTFEASTTDYATRFKLVFATGSNSDDSFAFFSNGNFIINNDGEATLQVIDVTGRILSSEYINGSTSVNVNAAPGVYMLRLINGNNVKVQKVVVE